MNIVKSVSSRVFSAPLLCVYLLVGSLLSSVLISPLKTNAASIYDNSYKTTDTLTVRDENLSCEEDVSANWSQYLTDLDKHPYYGPGYPFEDARESFLYALNNGGRWGVTQQDFGTNANIVTIFWTESSSLELTWDAGGVLAGPVHYVTLACGTGGSVNELGVYLMAGNYSNNFTGSAINNIWISLADESYLNYFVYTDGYENESIADGLSDVDEDGLNFAQESVQGTSDANGDTDSDGISDLKESRWFGDRDDVFCDTSIPKNCAYPDPTKKDVYVEVDWMNDTSTSTLLKPSSTQLGLVVSMFADEDINLHFDTGEYGGGNELPDYVAALRQDSVATIPDFDNYKSGGDGIIPNFDSDRLGIWRYMIYGNLYSKASGISSSSGWSEVLGDDLFISGGAVENVLGAVDIDRAVANTIAHELGHGLCLSDERVYFEQDEQCVFEGIDNDSGSEPINNADAYYDLEDYESVMNYRYQLTKKDDMGSVNYSHGPDSSTDHDDWSAVKAHIGGFNGSHTLYVEFGARGAKPVIDKPLSADGLIVAESTL